MAYSSPNYGHSDILFSPAYGGGLGMPLPPEPPKSQADCPKGTKFRYRTESDYGTGEIKNIPYCGQPESQADCGEGMTFYIDTPKSNCPPNAPCANIKRYSYAKCVPNDQCEKEWEAMNLFCSTKGKGSNYCNIYKSKEEFIKSCKAKYGIKETPVEVVTTALKPTTEEGEYKTWILATMIGVGLYLILGSRKSE